jgi:hypothetical protein
MPATSPLWTYPGTVTFQNATVSQVTAIQQIVILNTASNAAALGPVTASTGFTVSSDPAHPCGASLDATGVSDNGAWCMVDVSFTAPALGITTGTSERYLRLSITGNTGWSAAQIAEFKIFSGNMTNLALNKPVTASSTQPGYPGPNANDGNPGTYWEGNDGTWPTSLKVDLGTSDPLSSVVIHLPTSWPTRTQTLSVLGSADDTSWRTLAGPATCTWNPSTGGTVTIGLPPGTKDRYVELDFTANSVQNGA